MTSRYGRALAQLQTAQLQKTTRGLPAYTRFVNRPLGRRVAAGASLVGVTPNQVTVVGSVLTFGAIALLLVGPPSTARGCAVALLLAVGYVLDSADGALARLRGGGSPVGEWLDHVADALKHCLLHSAVLIGWYRWFDVRPVVLLVPIAFLVAAVMFFFTAMLTGALVKQYGGGPSSGQPASAFRALVLLPIDFGALLVSFVLWGSGTAFVVLYGVLAAATVVYLVLVTPKWYVDVRRLGRS